jgi:UDP-glucose 4-epimerase
LVIRKKTKPTKVVVTGVCGRLGRRVARVLHRERAVVGVDRRDFIGKPKDIEHQRLDLRRKKLRDVFRTGDVEAVIHLGVMHDPRASASDHHSWNVEGFGKLLEYVAQFDVKKLVVLSSANVYGPQPHNPQFLTEEAPLLGGARFSEIRDLIEVDMLAQSFFWKHPDVQTVILRPVHILGRVRNAASNFLRLPRVPTLLGYDPMVQVIHEADVVSAIVAGLSPEARGIFNVAGPEPMPLSHLLRILGRPTLPVPYSLAKPIMNRLWSLHLTSFPAPELDHIRYVCMVDDKRARDVLGYLPSHDAEETVRAVDD